MTGVQTCALPILREIGIRAERGGASACTVRVSQSSRCLAEPGSLPGSLLLLLVLESLSDANVILHQLVLLDVGGVVLLNWDTEDGSGSDRTRCVRHKGG